MIHNVEFSFCCKFHDIASVTFDKDNRVIITNFTMLSSGKWHRIEHGGANFSQQAELRHNATVIVQEFSFETLSPVLIKVFEEVQISCKVVFAHKMTAGVFLIHGIEFCEDATQGFTGLRYKDARCFVEPTDLTPTIRVSGMSKTLAPICVMKESEFEAL